MYIITSINDKKFSLNGIQYLKNYLSATYNQKIEIFNCYERQDVLVEQTVYSEFSVNGITYNSAAALQAALLDVLYSRTNLGTNTIEQDNIDIKKYFNFEQGSSLFAIIDKINSIPSFLLGEKESLWLIGREVTTRNGFQSPTGKVYKYKVMNNGKGMYGSQTGQYLPFRILRSDNIELISVEGLSPADIENDPYTQVNNYGELTGQAVWQWLNNMPIPVTIQAQDDGYVIFKGSINGVAKSYLWIGGHGMYGSGNLQSSGADFQIVEDRQASFVNQDNIDIRKYFLYNSSESNTQILAKINNIAPYTVNEHQSVWIIGTERVSVSNPNPLKIKYKVMNVGKGTYGSGSTQLTWDNLELITMPAPVTTPDIETDPNTQVILYGELTGETIESWLNEQSPAIELQSQDEGYVFFKGLIDGSARSYLWIGVDGNYGVGYQQSTEVDFQLVDDTILTVAQDLQGVLNNGSIAQIDGQLEIDTSGFRLSSGANGQIYTNQDGITLNGNNRGINLNGSVDGVTISGQQGSVKLNGGSGGVIVNTNGGLFRVNGAFPSSGIQLHGATIVDASGYDFTIKGAPTFRGAIYDQDYSDNFTNRSLIDKAYVDDKVDSCIPLSGTTVDNPVTGTLELESDLKLSADSTIKTINGIISDNSTGLKIYNENNIIIQSNETGSGLKGYHDYTANITDLDYVQKKYVDDVLDNAVSTVRQDLPDDIFISCTYAAQPVQGQYLTYITDQIRKFDLNALFGNQIPTPYTRIYATYSIEKNNNDLFIIFQFGDGTNISSRALMILKDCYLLNNGLNVGQLYFKVLDGLYTSSTGTAAELHGSTYINGFLYYSTRPSSSTTPNQIIRINPYDLSDYKILELPTNEIRFQGYTTTIDSFDNWIYILIRKNNNQIGPLGHIIKIHSSLDYYETVFTYGSDPTKAVGRATYFVISNGEIIFPTINLSAGQPITGNTMGLAIFTMDGRLKREINNITINNIGAGLPNPHWMTVFNNKVIINYTDLNGTSENKLVRLDIGHGTVGQYNYAPIVFEEAYWNYGVNNFTNDNSLLKDGYLYMNCEGGFDYLYKIKYNDFENFTQVEGTNGYYSLASINPKIQKESLKTKVSEFKNDGDGTSAFVTATQLASKQNQLLAGTNITINNNADGTSTISSAGGGSGGAANLNYTPSPTGGTIYSDTGTDAALPLADINNAGLLSPADKAKIDAIIEYAAPYALTPTWVGTTPPSGTMTATWQATKTGKHVNGRINIRNTVNGSAITGIILPLPAELPIPTNIPGFGASNDYMYPVTGFLSSGPTSGYGTAATRGALRKTAGSYEFVLTQASGTFGTVHLVFDYWTE